MIWSMFLAVLSLASARHVRKVDPAYLEALRSSGQDAEFAKLLGVDVSLVKSDDKEERSDGKMKNVSPLGDILMLGEQKQDRQGWETKINMEKYGGSKWTNGVIPYYIIRNDFSEDQIRFIESAISDFNMRVEKLKLVPLRKERKESHYVVVINGNGCWSYQGRIGGQQPLSLQRNGCLTNGTVQHQFMHAIGFTHEHNRPDRDNHVRVLWDNIPEEWQSQYEKNNENDFKNISSYDYYSLMHYPILAPGTKKDAFEILEEGIDRDRVGQNDGMSDLDVQKINELYS